jgi:phosphoglycolate phosphatase
MAYIVFDFDGTLADMKSLIMEVGNEIAAKKGWPPVDEATYQELSKGNIKDGLQHLGIPLRDVPFALIQGKRMLSRRVDEINLFPGIPELVTGLRASGHELFVLSTNSRKLIKTVLVRHKLADKLTVLPSSGLFGKAPVLKRFMRSRKLPKQAVWVIGDELRDIEAAKRVGVQSIAVTWGLQHPDTLQAAKPTFVVDTPQQIAAYLRNAT